VLRVEAGATTLLLTGDVEPEAQRDLVRRGVNLRADVLKVPHHGSRHQDPAFLRAVGAAVVVTSVGAENDYGHPSAPVLDALQGAGARSFRTDLDGDVALAHRAGRLVVVGRSGPARRADRPRRTCRDGAAFRTRNVADRARPTPVPTLRRTGRCVAA
jgi:competence protein ComEC